MRLCLILVTLLEDKGFTWRYRYIVTLLVGRTLSWKTAGEFDLVVGKARKNEVNGRNN